MIGVDVQFDSLFSGCGGMDLGLERAGWHVRRQCELDADAQAVLRRHWPSAELHADVRTFQGTQVDALAGGFPCQNLSTANVSTRIGLDGPSSGLWREFRRVIGEASPRWVVIENSGASWRQWVPAVRGDLRQLGYSSVCLHLRASDFGAPFSGLRAFVVAASYSHGESTGAVDAKTRLLCSAPGPSRQDWGTPSARALGVVDGASRGVDSSRLRLAGNAVVPAMAEYVGRLINDLDQ